MDSAAFVVSVWRTAIVSLVAVLLPVSALAQKAPDRRLEVGGDFRWLAPVRFSDVNANETAFGGAQRAVFKSQSRFQQGACGGVRVAVPLTTLVDAEASVAFGRTHLSTAISADPEAPNTTVTEPVTEYLGEAGVAAHLARWQTRRAAPFVSAGIGYLRELHGGGAFVQSGRAWYVGAGLRYLPRGPSTGGRRTIGLRAELRATILPGRLTLDGSPHILPAAIAGVFVGY